jgi:BMFP domain-containing protein YqiC
MDVARRAREQAEDLAARVEALEAKAFSSQVALLGDSENATKHSKAVPKSGGKSSSAT